MLPCGTPDKTSSAFFSFFFHEILQARMISRRFTPQETLEVMAFSLTLQATTQLLVQIYVATCTGHNIIDDEI